MPWKALSLSDPGLVSHFTLSFIFTKGFIITQILKLISYPNDIKYTVTEIQVPGLNFKAYHTFITVLVIFKNTSASLLPHAIDLQGSGPGVSACLWALQAFKKAVDKPAKLDWCSQNLVFWWGDKISSKDLPHHNCGCCRGERHEGSGAGKPATLSEVFKCLLYEHIHLLLVVSLSGTSRDHEEGPGKRRPRGRQWRWGKHQVVTVRVGLG